MFPRVCSSLISSLDQVLISKLLEYFAASYCCPVELRTYYCTSWTYSYSSRHNQRTCIEVYTRYFTLSQYPECHARREVFDTCAAAWHHQACCCPFPSRGQYGPRVSSALLSSVYHVCLPRAVCSRYLVYHTVVLHLPPSSP